MTGLIAPCGLWQSEHLILPSTMGWCEGLSVCERMSLWQLPQISDSLGRKLVVNGAIRGCDSLPWMLWQLLHATSFKACLPDSQNARWRLVWWQARQTAAF